MEVKEAHEALLFSYKIYKQVRHGGVYLLIVAQRQVDLCKFKANLVYM